MPIEPVAGEVSAGTDGAAAIVVNENDDDVALPPAFVAITFQKYVVLFNSPVGVEEVPVMPL
jgi:hypothetical protein